MLNIEEVHCTAAIHAVLAANLHLLHATVEEVLQPIDRHTPDKADTLGLDGIPESTIANTLRSFDQSAVLITEEIGSTGVMWALDHGGSVPPTIYISDPTDRSKQLKEFFLSQPPHVKVGELVAAPDAIAQWEERFSKPATITGATSAITCVHHGSPINAVIVNFISQQLTIAYRAGVFTLSLPKYDELDPAAITLDYIRRNGTTVSFHKFQSTGSGMAHMRRFVTYLGKAGYRENFDDSRLLSHDDAKVYLHYHEPGGPSRVLYLSTLQPSDEPVGFVFANGEKIGEWIHWLPFIRFGTVEGEAARHALNLYEIHQARPWTKEGILMSTPGPYSIFTESNSRDGKMLLDIERLQSFANPSRYRSSLVVAPASNTWATNVAETHVYRRIEFADPR